MNSPKVLPAALLLISFLFMSLPMPISKADSTVVVLSPSDGSSVCPTFNGGTIGSQPGVWNASTYTCMFLGNATAPESFGVQSPVDELVIDSGVTLNVSAHCESGTPFQDCFMVVLTKLVNNGTIDAGIVNYGVIENHGTINIPNWPSEFQNLPYDDLGMIYNLKGGTINNGNYLLNAGTIINNGTFNNNGEVVNDIYGCDPSPPDCHFTNGTLTNLGTFLGSDPTPTWLSTFGPVALTNGTGTADDVRETGISVTINEASGDFAVVYTQVEGTDQVPNYTLLSPSLGSAAYYDVMIKGISSGEADVCIVSSGASTNTTPTNVTSWMGYWNGRQWEDASNIRVQNWTEVETTEQTSQNHTAVYDRNFVCGDIPVTELVGTALAVGVMLTSPITSSGGVPEITVQVGLALLAVAIIVASYVVVKRVMPPHSDSTTRSG